MLLGIDIGGTTITFGLVEDREIVDSWSVPSFPSSASKEETLDYLALNIAKAINPETDRIGIGVPSVVDVERGIVYDATNIPSWDEVHIKERLEERFGIPVNVNNDSNCFALGAAASLERPAKIVAGVTMGTGTGVGVVVDGALLSGPNCGVGEIGAIPYNGADYETFCSKKFFVAKGLDAKDVAIRALTGDKDSLAIYHEFGRHMGEFLSVVMYAYDPDCIILGGGLSNAFTLFRGTMFDSLKARFLYPRSLEKLRIQAMTQENLALLGASLL